MSSYHDNSIGQETEVMMTALRQFIENFTSSETNDNSDLLRSEARNELPDMHLHETFPTNCTDDMLDPDEDRDSTTDSLLGSNSRLNTNTKNHLDLGTSCTDSFLRSQDSGKGRKEATPPGSYKSKHKKTSLMHRAHPYKFPYQCNRLPVTTSSGISDHGNCDVPSLDPRSAALGVMGLKKISNLGGPDKPNTMLCEKPLHPNMKYVLKFFEKNSDRFFREMDTVRNICHPNVLKPISFRMGKSMSFTVTQYCSKGSLATHIGEMDIETIIKHFIKIASALSFLHSHQMYHRDLRPENIMIDDGNNPLIADFGMADNLQPENAVISNRMKTEADVENARLSGAKVDSFFLGAVLHCMLFKVQYHECYDFFDQTKSEKFPDGKMFAILKRTIVNLVTPELSARWNVERVLGLFVKHHQLLHEFCKVKRLNDIDPNFAKNVRRWERQRARHINTKIINNSKNQSKTGTSINCK